MYLQEIFDSFGISNITLSGHIQNVATMACRLPQDWIYELYFVQERVNVLRK